MKTAIIDTSVWISFLFKSESTTSESERIFSELINSGCQILVPTLVLVEICATAKRIFGKNYKFENILKRLQFRNIKFIDLNLEQTVTLLSLERFEYLKASDFLILLYSFYFRPNKFFSFDSHQNQVYHQFINTIPHEKN